MSSEAIEVAKRRVASAEKRVSSAFMLVESVKIEVTISSKAIGAANCHLASAKKRAPSASALLKSAKCEATLAEKELREANKSLDKLENNNSLQVMNDSKMGITKGSKHKKNNGNSENGKDDNNAASHVEGTPRRYGFRFQLKADSAEANRRVDKCGSEDRRNEENAVSDSNVSRRCGFRF
mmetsp:Transcript_33070/g.69413  ORF Transcript_33070/g.69413 Transcript_33070/m.69413 type:complete len:181 (+) Transcript_33070:2224-2766(+)